MNNRDTNTNSNAAAAINGGGSCSFEEFVKLKQENKELKLEVSYYS